MTNRFSQKQLVFSIGLITALLIPLLPLPQPIAVSGHPWKVELSLFLVLSVFFVFQIFGKDVLIRWDKLKGFHIFLFLFVSWSALSLIWSTSGWSVFHHTALWIAYGLAFLMTAQAVNKRNGVDGIVSVLSVFAILLGTLMILGYVQVMLNPSYEGSFRSTYSKYSEILVLLNPIFLALASRARNKYTRYHIAAAILSFTAIALSLSRASFIAAIAGLFVFVFLTLIFFRSKQNLIRTFSLLAVFAVIFVATQFVSTGSQNETTLYTRFTSTSGYQTSSTDIRMLLMGVSGEMISRNPILGVGADNFGIELNKYRGFYAEKATNKELLSAGEEVMLERAHNEFLQIVSELGVVGGLLFCAMFAGGLALFLSRIKSLKKGPELVLKLGAAAGICGFLVSSLVSSFSFRAIQNGFLFFVVLGLALHSFKRFEFPSGSGRLVWGMALSFSLFAVGMITLQATSGYLIAQAVSTSNPAKAKALLARAGSIDKTNASVNLSLANLFLTSSDFGKAAEQFDTAIQKGAGTIGIYHWTIRSHQLAGELEKAVTIARECVEIYPQSISARVLLSHLLKKHGDKKAAGKEFSTALEIDKHAAATWLLVLEQGPLKTSLEARKNKSIIPFADLGPSSAVNSELALEKLLEK